MRILSHKTLKDFYTKHSNCETAISCWYKLTKDAEWTSFNDLRKTFPSTDHVAPNRYIFDIKGNHYRLITAINFEHQIVYIRFLGTHAQYDKVNPSTI